MSLDNAFRVTANGQFVQDVNLAPGTYTLNCCVNSPNSNYYCRLYNGSDIVDLSTSITPGIWNLAVITFTLTKTMTKFEIARNGSSNYPIIVGRPMFEVGNNASTPRPSDLDLDERIDESNTEILQTKQSITLLANRTSNVEGRLTASESSITTLSNQIALKVSQSEFDELGNRVSANESNITLLSGEISLKVSVTEFDGFKTTLTQTGIDIVNKKITLTANNTVFQNNSGVPIAVFNSDWTKIKADVISLEGIVTANDNFKVLLDGSIEAVNGKFSGLIQSASSGNRITIDPDTRTMLFKSSDNLEFIKMAFDVAGSDKTSFLRINTYLGTTLNSYTEYRGRGQESYIGNYSGKYGAGSMTLYYSSSGATFEVATNIGNSYGLNKLIVKMGRLPTSSSGLPSGALYRDGTTIKIV